MDTYKVFLGCLLLFICNYYAVLVVYNRCQGDSSISRTPIHLCPNTPEQLGLGREIKPNLTIPEWQDLELLHYDLENGGKFTPPDCTARHNVAIIVPYRDRERQLRLFIQHIHPFLKRQKIAYTIYVIEQVSGVAFNRGLVRNVGFVEALSLDSTHDCTVFHDVDLLPLHEANMYTCPDQPRHVCLAVNYFKNFTPVYKGYAKFGHVVFFRNDHFRLVNGYSNIYLGWGAEDDDLHVRVTARQMTPYRYPDHIGRYYGIPHADESLMPRPNTTAKNVDRFLLLEFAKRRMYRDGLNSLRYKVIKVNKSKLFTRIMVDVDENRYAGEALAVERGHKLAFKKITEHRRNIRLV